MAGNGASRRTAGQASAAEQSRSPLSWLSAMIILTVRGRLARLAGEQDEAVLLELIVLPGLAALFELAVLIGWPRGQNALGGRRGRPGGSWHRDCRGRSGGA